MFTTEHSLQLAAQCWCDLETSNTQMDPVLATAFAKRLETLMNSIETAWGIIANAYGGDWDLASDDWRKAATRWRDEDWGGLLKKLAKPDKD